MHEAFQRFQVACTLVVGAEIAAVLAATLSECCAFAFVGAVILAPSEFLQFMMALSRNSHGMHPFVDLIREALLVIGTTALFLRLVFRSVQHPVSLPNLTHVYARDRDDYHGASLTRLLTNPYIYYGAVLTINLPLWAVFREVGELTLYATTPLIAMPIAMLAWISTQSGQRTPAPQRRPR